MQWVVLQVAVKNLRGGHDSLKNLENLLIFFFILSLSQMVRFALISLLQNFFGSGETNMISVNVM